MMLNTYEHGWSDGLHNRHSILHRSQDYEQGYAAGQRYRRRDLHVTSALFVTLILVGISGIFMGLAA